MGEESPGKVCGIVKVKQELVGAKKTYKVKKYFCFQLNIRNYLCFEPDPDHPCEERLGEFPPLLSSSPSHIPSRPYVHLLLLYYYVHLVKIAISFSFLNYSHDPLTTPVQLKVMQRHFKL